MANLKFPNLFLGTYLLDVSLSKICLRRRSKCCPPNIHATAANEYIHAIPARAITCAIRYHVLVQVKIAHTNFIAIYSELDIWLEFLIGDVGPLQPLDYYRDILCCSVVNTTVVHTFTLGWINPLPLPLPTLSYIRTCNILL